MTDEGEQIPCVFRRCPQCGQDILCLLNGSTPRSCDDHD